MLMLNPRLELNLGRAWLLGWGIVFAWVTLMAYRRDRGRRFA